LTQSMPKCPYQINLGQKFPACGEGSPGTLYLSVSGKSPVPATVTIDGPGGQVYRTPVTGDFAHEVLAESVGQPEGEIPFTAKLMANNGTEVAKTAKIAVDRSAPIASILVPAAGAAQCGRLDPRNQREYVDVTAEVTDFSATTLVSAEWLDPNGSWRPRLCGDNGTRPCDTATFTSGQPQALPWDLTEANGYTAVRMGFCDRAGYKTFVERPFTLVKDPPQLVTSGVSRPVFSPNGDGKADDTRVTVTSFQPLSFSVEVLTPAGQLVRRVVTGETRAAGNNTFT